MACSFEVTCPTIGKDWKPPLCLRRHACADAAPRPLASTSQTARSLLCSSSSAPSSTCQVPYQLSSAACGIFTFPPHRTSPLHAPSKPAIPPPSHPAEFEIGVLLTLILAGDLVVTLYLSTSADAFGRRKILVIGSLLKVLAGAVFASTRSFPVLVIAGIVGVISTSGGECGPFINVEQAALTDACLAAPPPASGRDAAAHGGAGRVAVLFGWYNALGYTAQALGSLSSGLAVRYLPFPPLVSHKIIFVAYGLIGTAMALLYSSLSPAVESPAAAALAAAAGGGSAGRWWLPRVSLGLRRPESKCALPLLSPPAFTACCALFRLPSDAHACFTDTLWRAFRPCSRSTPLAAPSSCSPSSPSGSRRGADTQASSHWNNTSLAEYLPAQFCGRCLCSITAYLSSRWQFSADLIGYLLMTANVIAARTALLNNRLTHAPYLLSYAPRGSHLTRLTRPSAFSQRRGSPELSPRSSCGAWAPC